MLLTKTASARILLKTKNTLYVIGNHESGLVATVPVIIFKETAQASATCPLTTKYGATLQLIRMIFFWPLYSLLETECC